MSRTGEKEVIEADLVLLSMGFVHPAQDDVVAELQLAIDPRKNIRCDDSMRASHKKVFVAGDATTGASLVVRAMASAQKAAENIDRFLR
jgi:glutamate synthase (NADPH/NADH) small chain